MKKIVLQVILSCFSATVLFAQTSGERAFQFSFLSPIGTNGIQSHLITNKVSINLIGGYSYGNTSLELGSIYNINLHLTKGVLLAGVANYSGYAEKATQIAGVLNIASKGAIAAQISGMINSAKEVKGAQIAGVINQSQYADHATQIAGVVNTDYEGTVATQISGVINSARTVKGAQIAGIINQSQYADHATQITGVANINSKGTVAAQIGGVINSANRVKGVQIGLFNYADTCDGVAIGLINIVRKGGKHELEISFSEALNTAVTFKLGTNKLYTIFSLGINYLNSPVQYAYGFGLGTHQNWKKDWGSQIEVVGYQLTEDGKFRGDIDMLTQLKFTVSKQIASHFKVFAGPVLNMTISDYVNPETGKSGSTLSPWSMWKNKSEKTRLNSWVGFTAGVRF